MAEAAPRTYSLGTKCLAELLGTMMGVYLGCSVVANALLPKAKGQSMGFGFISIGYGLAFFFPILIFGHVSANLNPAFCLANWIMGLSSVEEFFALSGAEMAGAFLGGVCTWLHWLPHFKTVPEPPAPNPGDRLLRNRDALPGNAIEIASYNTQQPQTAAALRRRRPTRRSGATAAAAAAAAAAAPMPGGGSLRRQQSERVRRGMTNIKNGFMDHARGWLSDVGYYLVHPHMFRVPRSFKHEQQAQEQQEQQEQLCRPSGKPSTLASAALNGVPGRPQSHSSDSGGSGRPSRETLHPVQEDEESGSGLVPNRLQPARPGAMSDSDFWDAGSTSRPDGAEVTRSTLQGILQQEHLAMRVKMQAPALAAYIQTAGSLAPIPSVPVSAVESRLEGELPSVGLNLAPSSAAGPPGAADASLPHDDSGKHSPFDTMSSVPFTADHQRPSARFSSLQPGATAAGGVESAAGTHKSGPLLGAGLATLVENADPAAAAAAVLEDERRHVMALYDAAVIADQNAKLSVFTTRPAIYAPPFNWLSEFMATVVLVVGCKLMNEQMRKEGQAGSVLQPYYVGFFITCLLLGLGGTTGFSVNAARDLGPRIAHAVLPIPNKGPSEWFYGWIPVTASLAGGAVGAVIFLGINQWLN